MSVPLSFGWRHLLFANWPVEGSRLASHLPERLSVDEFQSTGWLSVLAFRNVRTRPRGFPAVLGVDFAELNLRTYVVADGEPGIYFFSLDAASLPSVIGARLFHRLPYYYARVRLRWRDGRAHVRSRRRHPGARPARFVASYAPEGESFTPDPASLAGFLTERRRLYTESQDETLRHTDVRHPRWTLYSADVDIETNTLVRASGFEDQTDDPECFYSPGVDVSTTGSEPWTDRTL